MSMYTEEHLQNHEDAYSEDEITVSVSSDYSYDSNLLKEKIDVELMKRQDADYRKQKTILPDGSFLKIESYCTPFIIGSRIRHAITGKRTHCHVGTRDESAFFIVTDTTAPSQTPRRLYYNSPEEYERHYRINLSTDIKNAFLHKK